MKSQWLDRGLIRGPFYTLCLNEAAFAKEIAHVRLKEKPRFLSTDHANATTHFMVDPEGKTCAIVCMHPPEDQDPIVVAGLLVHEAVHIWQEWCLEVGETSPGRETEAYSIQWISQQLMWEFVRQSAKPSTRP